jgi:uncharacterized protein (TIGR00730 family)
VTGPNAPDAPVDVEALLDALGVTEHRRLLADLLGSAVGLATDGTNPLDLKIAAAALGEMREAFLMFAPYRDRPKVTVFGSARTRHDDPLYQQARQVARLLAGEGYMVVTGAGPGIMEAAMEGAGRERSIGVSIRLPFEQGANAVIAGDPKYVSMRYFFTRKLMLVKESQAFVCLPGGFGTLDETFELLTLTQTGKGLPVPIVLLDIDGDPYWESVEGFIRDQLVSRGLVAAQDTELFAVCHTCEDAVAEIVGFYRNYDSIRYVGDQLVMRLRRAPDDRELARLNHDFGHLCVDGGITRTEPLAVEVREQDRLHLQRIQFTFAKHGYGELRRLIDALNELV